MDGKKKTLKKEYYLQGTKNGVILWAFRIATFVDLKQEEQRFWFLDRNPQ